MTSQAANLDRRAAITPGSTQQFGTLPDGSAVTLVSLARGGTTLNVMTWGASLQDFRRDGADHSFVLGCDQFDAYLAELKYFGAIVGPVANRLANGSFRIDGTVFDLDRNENGVTTLHGGATGLGEQNWTLDGYDAASCRFVCRHRDGEGGFPGNLDVQATYSLDESGGLCLQLSAVTDAVTYCNLAQHSFWNMDGADDLGGHDFAVNASRYLPIDDRLIPLENAPVPVSDSLFDFTEMRPLVKDPDFVLDHNFCLEGDAGIMRPACQLRAGGFQLDVETTEPGLQVYDGSGINTAGWIGHSGRPYGARAGIALEPQNWPDAPNRPDFPSALLLPGETYQQRSRFRVTPL